MLELLFNEYYYYHNGDEGDGRLVYKSDQGDTLLPYEKGKFTILQRATSLEDAAIKAEEWDDQQ